MKKIRIAQIGMNRYSHAPEIFYTLSIHPEIFELVGYTLVEDEREYCYTSDKGFGNPGQGEKVDQVETDGKNPQHPAILANFTAYMLGKEELFVDGKEGLKGVMLMDAMLFSGFTGEMVELPFDDEAFYVEHQKRVATGRVKEGESVVLDTAGSYGTK